MTDQFWNDQARELIAVTASKLNLVREDTEQRAQLLAALTRDNLFPDKTGEMEAVIAAEGSWSFHGSFEECTPSTALSSADPLSRKPSRSLPTLATASPPE